MESDGRRRHHSRPCRRVCGIGDAVRRGAAALRIVLYPRPLTESVTVTASRGATGVDTAASSTVVTSAELLTSAAGAVDDALRNTPGFSLFRRSSSRVANPTTQGVTLRGRSGSGASRTLVVADGVPLNDPSAAGCTGTAFRWRPSIASRSSAGRPAISTARTRSAASSRC